MTGRATLVGAMTKAALCDPSPFIFPTRPVKGGHPLGYVRGTAGPPQAPHLRRARAGPEGRPKKASELGPIVRIGLWREADPELWEMFKGPKAASCEVF